MTLLNYYNRILRLTFIGKLNDINKFQSNLIEEKVNKELIFLTKKILMKCKNCFIK